MTSLVVELLRAGYPSSEREKKVRRRLSGALHKTWNLAILLRSRALTAKKCTKKCNATSLLFRSSRCRRQNIERWFVSNGNAYELVLGRFLNFLKIWYYICTSLLLTFKKKPRVLTYLDFSAKAGAHSRRYYERTRRIKWNCFNNRKLKLYSAVIRHLWSIYFGVH